MIITPGSVDIYRLPGFKGEEGGEGRIIKICTSLCERYLFILTTRILYVYSNCHNIVILGSFSLDSDRYKNLGHFRDIFTLPGLYQIYLLVENTKKILVLKINTLNRNSSMTSLDSSRSDYDSLPKGFDSTVNITKTTSIFSEPCRYTGLDEITRVKELFDSYLMSFIEIYIAFVLILPSPISNVSESDSQLLFWTFDQFGLYVTISPGGFVNYLERMASYGQNIFLHLQSTNLHELKTKGMINRVLGLCFLNLNNTLYTMDGLLDASDTVGVGSASSPVGSFSNASVDSSKSIKLSFDNSDLRESVDDTSDQSIFLSGDRLYACEDLNGRRCTSLMGWVLSVKLSIDTIRDELDVGEPETSSSESLTPVTPSSLNADSILSIIESRDTVLYDDADNCIDNLVPSMYVRSVVVVEDFNICYLLTSIDSLLVFALNDAVTDDKYIGVLLYKSGVKSIKVNKGKRLFCLLLLNGEVLMYHYKGLCCDCLWKILLPGVLDLCWLADELFILCNNELKHYHYLGKLLNSNKLSDKFSSISATSHDFRLVLNKGVELHAFKVYTRDKSSIRCINPYIENASFIGVDDLLLVSVDLFDGFYGKCTLNQQLLFKTKYDHFNLVGNSNMRLDCKSFNTDGVLAQSSSNTSNWPILSASLNPITGYLLIATSTHYYLHKSVWILFGRNLGKFYGQGWYNDQIFYILTIKTFFNNEEAIYKAYCYFFTTEDVSTFLLTIPLNSMPTSTVVYDDNLIISGEDGSIIGYTLINDTVSKFDIKFQHSTEFKITQVHFLSLEKYLILDFFGNLYNQDLELIAEDCTNIIPYPRLYGNGIHGANEQSGSSHPDSLHLTEVPGNTSEGVVKSQGSTNLVEGKEGGYTHLRGCADMDSLDITPEFDYLCVIHGEIPHTLYISLDFEYKLDMLLDNAVLVDHGVLILINNNKLTRLVLSHYLSKFRVPQVLTLCNRVPFKLELLNQLISTFKDPSLVTNLHKFNVDIGQLFALISRKEHQIEVIRDFEVLFGYSTLKLFEDNIKRGHFSSASLMLLPLQTISGPKTVRCIYCVRIIKELIKKISSSKIYSCDDLNLLKSLLRFHRMAKDGSATERCKERESTTINTQSSHSARFSTFKPSRTSSYSPPSLKRDKSFNPADSHPAGDHSSISDMISWSASLVEGTKESTAHWRGGTGTSSEEAKLGCRINPVGGYMKYAYSARFYDTEGMCGNNDLLEYDTTELMLELFRASNLLSIYRLAVLFKLDLVSFLTPVKNDLKNWSDWGLCTTLGKCKSGGSSHPDSLHLTEVPGNTSEDVVKSQGSTNLVEGKEGGYTHRRGCVRGNLSTPLSHLFAHYMLQFETMTYDVGYCTKEDVNGVLSSHGICNYLIRVLTTLGLKVPALALALACSNPLALSYLIVHDREIAIFVEFVLNGHNKCTHCVDDFNLIKHTLHKTKKKLFYTPS